VDAALAVFVNAIAKGDPRTKQLWFDVTTVALPRRLLISATCSRLDSDN
jgi:hypothetical protein